MHAAVSIYAVILAALAFTQPAQADRIEVVAKLQHQNVARLAPKGRAGDAVSSVWVVRDRHGNAIGETLLDCRWVTQSLRLCFGQATLPLGTIIVGGASRTALLGQFVVVGGTGHYAGAYGSLIFTQIGIGKYVVSVNYQTR